MVFTDPQTYWLISILIVTGMFAGYTVGLFGIGGGVVMVPTLMTLLPYFQTSQDVVMHMAVGTSLALILPSASMATRKQYKMGMLDLNLLAYWVRTIILGVIAGSILIKFISTEELKIFFAVYLTIVTLYGIFQREAKGEVERIPSRLMMSIVGFFVGGLSVLLGIGGGTFTVPFFKFSNYPLKKAIALSTATSLVIGFGGTLGTLIDGWGIAGRTPYSWGFVNFPIVLLLAPGMMIFAPLGARTANCMPDKPLRIIYISFLGIMAAYMYWKIFS